MTETPMNLDKGQLALLKHLYKGGLVAIAVYGKKTLTMEILSRPKSLEAGLTRVEILRENGLVRNGDPSPYKSGTVTPVVLTEAGKSAVEQGG